MPDLYLYASPREATLTLTLDTGAMIPGDPCVAHGRDDAFRFALPADTPVQGGLVVATCAGYTPFSGRGIVDTEADPEPQFLFDHIQLQLEPLPPPDPPKPNPYQDPFAIIQAVYAQGDYDLATKEGCGCYTDASCQALAAQHYPLWGHIKKTPPQNNWAGHAVDAVMLLAKAGDTDAGIYDIILDTESPNAQPAWSYKGPPDPNLWMPA